MLYCSIGGQLNNTPLCNNPFSLPLAILLPFNFWDQNHCDPPETDLFMDDVSAYRLEHERIVNLITFWVSPCSTVSVQGVMSSRRGYCWTATSRWKGWIVCVVCSAGWDQFEPGFRQEVQITSACFELINPNTKWHDVFILLFLKESLEM